MYTSDVCGPEFTEPQKKRYFPPVDTNKRARVPFPRFFVLAAISARNVLPAIRGLWCRTLRNTKDLSERIAERNSTPRHPLMTTRKLSRSLLTLRRHVLALQRTIVGKNGVGRPLSPTPSFRETGKTIKGRRGAASPCMIMRCNLRHKRNDMVKEEEDYTARRGRRAGGMHETG